MSDEFQVHIGILSGWERGIECSQLTRRHGGTQGLSHAEDLSIRCRGCRNPENGTWESTAVGGDLVRRLLPADLGLLLLRPDESFHVREIERITGVPARSLHRELKVLAAAGLLRRMAVGNQVRYQADLACAIYGDLASIFRKTAGLADMLRELLAPVQEKIALAFVFGDPWLRENRGPRAILTCWWWVR